MLPSLRRCGARRAIVIVGAQWWSFPTGCSRVSEGVRRLTICSAVAGVSILRCKAVIVVTKLTTPFIAVSLPLVVLVGISLVVSDPGHHD